MLLPTDIGPVAIDTAIATATATATGTDTETDTNTASTTQVRGLARSRLGTRKNDKDIRSVSEAEAEAAMGRRHPRRQHETALTSERKGKREESQSHQLVDSGVHSSILTETPDPTSPVGTVGSISKDRDEGRARREAGRRRLGRTVLETSTTTLSDSVRRAISHHRGRRQILGGVDQGRQAEPAPTTTATPTATSIPSPARVQTQTQTPSQPQTQTQTQAQAQEQPLTPTLALPAPAPAITRTSANGDDGTNTRKQQQHGSGSEQTPLEPQTEISAATPGTTGAAHSSIGSLVGAGIGTGSSSSSRSRGGGYSYTGTDTPIFLSSFPADFPIETHETIETGDAGRGYIFLEDREVADSMLIFITFFTTLLVLTIVLIKANTLLSSSSNDQRGKVDNVIGDDMKWAEGREVVERKIIWQNAASSSSSGIKARGGRVSGMRGVPQRASKLRRG
ncbi:hypothetical protein IAU59_007019 [Kwoniella sp. CBS 9459]